VEKLLEKHLGQVGLAPTLFYPTGATRLRPQDVPGYQEPDAGAGEAESDAWAWFLKGENPPAYRRLHEGMAGLGPVISSAGGVDGVVGFSQGGCVAALLAAALESPRRAVPENGGPYDWGWVEALRAANGQRPLRFCVVYSGFSGVMPELEWLYEPKIRTPTLHFLGGLDTVVDEGRSRRLIDRCEDAVVVQHPGGHYVPVSREFVAPLVGFTRKHAGEPEAGSSTA